MNVDNEQSPAFTLSVDFALKVPKKNTRFTSSKVKKNI